jgi:hypothetical protein
MWMGDWGRFNPTCVVRENTSNWPSALAGGLFLRVIRHPYGMRFPFGWTYPALNAPGYCRMSLRGIYVSGLRCAGP